MFKLRVPKFRFGLIGLMLMLILVLSAGACDSGGGGTGGTGGGNTGGGTDVGVTPATVKYDANFCQYYEATAGGSTYKYDGLYCAKPVSGSQHPMWDFYLRSDLVNPVYRQEFAPGNESYAVQYWFSSKMWTRLPSSGVGQMEFCWWVDGVGCQWLTPEAYRQKVAEQVQARQVSEQQAAQAKKAAEAAAAANKAERDRVLAEFEERRIKAASVFLQPACNWSYNGCR